MQASKIDNFNTTTSFVEVFKCLYKHYFCSKTRAWSWRSWSWGRGRGRDGSQHFWNKNMVSSLKVCPKSACSVHSIGLSSARVGDSDPLAGHLIAIWQIL